MSPARALFHTAPRRVEIREVPVPRAAAADAFRAVDENAPGLMHAVLDYDGGPR
jgi:hypothetical protein